MERKQQRRWQQTVRLIALIAVVGLVGIGLGLGMANRSTASTQNADLIAGLRDGQARREAQDACAQKINAEWNAAFGQAAIAPVGSEARLQHALEAARILPRLEHIDVECYGVDATTTTTTTTAPSTPTTS